MNDTTDLLDNQELQNSDFQLSNEIMGYLREASRWAKFLAILGFIGVAFMVLGAISIGAIMGSMPTDIPIPGSVFSLLYLAMAALYFFPVYYLYKFSSDIGRALDFKDNALLASAFKFLKSHYKFLGISVIVVIALYFVLIIAMIVGAGSLAGLAN